MAAAFELFGHQTLPLEPSVIEQIRLGDWSPSVTDKLTHALLSNEPDIESRLCSQLLQGLCTIDDGLGAIDSKVFGQNVARWIEYCIAATKNSNNDPSAETQIRARIEEAFIETIWTLSVEWEPESADLDDIRWKAEVQKSTEQRKQLLQITSSLLANQVVTQDVAKERLDPEFLEKLAIIPSATTFTRKYIRLNTTLNFKQTKYNLVSEQNEGFSKLVTLIQATMGSVVPHQVANGILEHTSAMSLDTRNGSAVLLALRSISDLQSTIRGLLLDIQRLIGIFSLDPNRVLDIILDCFMSSVRFYWAFYIALLDASPWCKTAAESLKVAQLVGWKLQFYLNGPAADHKYMDELLTMAALLISHRLIRLSDLYAMLAPNTPEGIEKEFEAWSLKQKEQETGGMGGLLSKMGGLEDGGEEGEDPEADEAGTGEIASEWANQHAILCEKLLAIGDTESALFYLKRYPDMARTHPSIGDLVVRIIDASTRTLYENTACIRAPAKLPLKLKISIDQETNDQDVSTNKWGLPVVASDTLTDAHANAQIHVLTPLLQRPSEVFFYERFWLLDMASRLPVVNNVCDMPRVLAPWLNIAFLRLHQFPALLTRLIRLCRYGLANLQESASTDALVGFLRAWILPAFSLCLPSAGMSNELWLLVSGLPLAQRYQLYGSWDAMLSSGRPTLPHVFAGNMQTGGAGQRQATPDHLLSMDMALDEALGDDDIDDEDAAMGDENFGQHSLATFVELQALFSENRRQVRSVMRRLSGDTVKLMGRRLCNLCHATPTLSLKIILDQVCSYDNLVDSVVEAFRYLTPMDADVMFYTILKILSDPTSAKVKEDGVNAAHWLQSLSSFIAAFSHRHENLRLDVVLDYVLKLTISMARSEKPLPVPELTVLSDSVLRLAGIPFMANAAEEQILALQGGHYLGLEAFNMVSAWAIHQDTTVDSIIAASSENRLARRMSLWMTNMVVSRAQALPFIVSVCVHAESVLKAATLPLSNLLVVYDREVERVYQLFNLLYYNLKPEKFIKLVPGPHVLASQYGLSWDMAVLWGRPAISVHLAQGLKQWEEDGEKVHVEIFEQEEPTESDRPDESNDSAEPVKPAGSIDQEGAMVADSPKPEDATINDTTATPADIIDIVGAAVDAADAADAKDMIPDDPSPAAEAVQDDSKMDTDNIQDIAAEDKSKAAADKPRVVSSLQFQVPLIPRDYVDYIAQTMPASARDLGISPEFVAVFWTLTLGDIDVPFDRYKKETEVHANLIKRIDLLTKQSTSRSKNSALAQIRARAALAIDSLEKEMAEQKLHVSRIRRWLIAQKDYWFCMATEQRKAVTQALIQTCILPRAVLSASDASFCAKFLWVLHYPLATNKFSLMIVYDNIFSESLSPLLASFTENEARNYAKFLSACLSFLAPMHQSEIHYKERATNSWRGLTSFQQHSRYERGYLPPKSRTIGIAMPAGASNSDSGDSQRIRGDTSMLSFDDFRTVMRKWQVNLTKVFMNILDSERTDTVRNGIWALKEMTRTFPVIAQYGRRILDKVNDIAERGRLTKSKDAQQSGSPAESNKNLMVMATSYSMYLNMAKKSWIPESDYYPVPPKDTATSHTVRQPRSVNTTTPAKAQEGSTPAQMPKRGGDISAASVDLRVDTPVSDKPRPSVSRSISSGAIAAAAAASVASAASTSVTVASPSNTQGKQAKPDANVSSRQQDTANTGGSGRDQEFKHPRERGKSDRNFRSNERDRRENRSARDSPMRHDREETHSDSHRRHRDSSNVSDKPDSSRQRQPTPSSLAMQGKSPNISDLHISSPSSTPATTQQTGKLSNEEADRKKKELRAQLLRQQEEKQKHKTDSLQIDVAADRRERESRHNSSRESSKARDTGAYNSDTKTDNRGDSRGDPRGDYRDGSRRYGRRGFDRYADSGGGGNPNLMPVARVDGRDKSGRKQIDNHISNAGDSGPGDRQGPSANRSHQQQHQSQTGGDRNQRRNGRGPNSNPNHNSNNNASPSPAVQRGGGGGGGGGGDRRQPGGISNDKSAISIRNSGGRQGKDDGDRGAGAGTQNRRGAMGGQKGDNRGDINNSGGSIRRGPKRGRGNDPPRDWENGKRHRK
ncbi:THO2 plays a role in transcriptional elongation [Coemansia sp. Benny D115]|nr:THO2 plays a role in transcriptional elongation [Coemansia sp. Benny D115]